MGYGQACPCKHTNGRCNTVKTIIAIYDKRAEDIVGILQMHHHEATAVRMFADVAMNETSQIRRHPEDYDLIQLGTLNNDNNRITPEYRVILTGSALFASQAEGPKEVK